jgi:hypothetical protein
MSTKARNVEAICSGAKPNERRSTQSASKRTVFEIQISFVVNRSLALDGIVHGEKPHQKISIDR